MVTPGGDSLKASLCSFLLLLVIITVQSDGWSQHCSACCTMYRVTMMLSNSAPLELVALMAGDVYSYISFSLWDVHVPVTSPASWLRLLPQVTVRGCVSITLAIASKGGGC